MRCYALPEEGMIELARKYGSIALPNFWELIILSVKTCWTTLYMMPSASWIKGLIGHTKNSWKNVQMKVEEGFLKEF